MSNAIPQSTENGNNLQSRAPLKIAIIGGGLVGSLAALSFARRGHEVHLYEYREDIRTAELVQGRSINLALSQRGRKALAEVGLEQEVLATAIPMRGRMLHDIKGNRTVVLYDPCTNQCLYSVGRKYLNEVLLNAGEKFPNIQRHFEHKLNYVNLTHGRMEFKRAPNKEIVEANADLVVGCDGAFSTMRQQLVKTPGVNYSQEYIEHGYLELCIPAKNGEFQMPENYLHIWPRDAFMMIALPNQDKSFTVTLSMPFKVFDTIRTNEELLNFFHKYYADAVPLIGEERLLKDFFKMPPQHLVSVKCHPYHYGDKALILGDAAHAMVPYYGQGLNAGMEDCTLLMSLFDQPNLSTAEILEQFTELRWRDAHAVCDLAMYNYVEMRDLTKRISFRCRKWLDTQLFRWFPSWWVPLYNSVSFTSMPYSKCILNRKWQDKLLSNVFISASVALVVMGLSTYFGVFKISYF
ncbi:PREDICTED: kynurenine 3-monooxygenase isoform X1 [Bactrocera latifrons]|uniref:Kynurenine 3-monooxygenase n=1 Tax=Bactrocera latifrons TaxID=174628 RepID=A0A0K8W6G4_BACLA|nr:PREDICTED: kynurenine 3-monooxygenase isoform X1 [Bactrocera latifrons]